MKEKLKKQEKKILVVDDYIMIDKVLGNIKERIGIEKFDDTKILIDSDDELPDDIASKNVAILISQHFLKQYHLAIHHRRWQVFSTNIFRRKIFC